MVNWHLWEPFGAPLWRCRCISKWWMIHGDVCVHPTFQNIHPNSSFKSEPNMYWAAALPATRPKTTQSKSELPPKRLLPCTPPATCQGENLWKSAWNLWGWSQVAWGSCFLFFFGGGEQKMQKNTSFSKRGHPGCFYLAKLWYAWYKWGNERKPCKKLRCQRCI